MRVEKKTETREKDVEREGRLCLKCFRGSFLLAPISEIGGLVLFSVFLVSCFLWFSPDAQASTGFERYEIILSRLPFGKEPPPEEVVEPARPSGEFAKQYRLSMLYKDAQGQLKAGLVSKVNNKSLLLQIGESGEGVSLIDVLLEEGMAVLGSGGETARLLLEGLPQSGPVQTASAAGGSGSSAGNPVAEARQQTFRRQGAPDVAQHIVSRLEDAAPKRAVISRRPAPSGGRAAGSPSASSVGGSEEERESRSETALADSGNKRQVRTEQKGGSYSIQSVPLYVERKMLARGL